MFVVMRSTRAKFTHSPHNPHHITQSDNQRCHCVIRHEPEDCYRGSYYSTHYVVPLQYVPYVLTDAAATQAVNL